MVTVLYLNLLQVPSGHMTFLQSQVAGGGLENRGFFPYEQGITFVPTLFVPYRWRKYQLEIQSKVQEIKIKLPLRYSAYLRLNDLFYVQMKLKIEGEIPATEAFAALKALQLKPVERDKFIEDQLQFLAAEYFIDINSDEKNLEKVKTQLTGFFNNNNLAELQKRLDAQLRAPWFKLKSIELRDLYVPDSQIYAAQTKNLDQVAAADRRALLVQIEKEADLALERKRNHEDLAKAERMGALVAENPDILEYYKIEKIAPRAGNVILDAAGGQKRNLTIQSDKKPARGRDGKGENSDGGEIGRAE
ncbi:MAG: hypothetical protein J0L53_11300 [Spirochaetes bacterium]|nr:hypothetical protein [Spirochaetota bacterium]